MRDVIKLFLGIALLQLYSVMACGQSTLKQRIDFRVHDARFEDVMLSLADAGQFSFSYNPALLPVDSVISIDAEDTPIRTILASMLGQEMEIRQQGNHLVILRTRYTPEPADTPDSGRTTHRIHGYIRNNGTSVAGATVFDIRSMQSAVTDQEGHYTLDIPVKYPIIGLSVLSRGIVDTTLILENRERQVDIALRPTGTRTVRLPRHGAPEINQRSIVKLVASDEGISRTEGKSLSVQRTAQISLVPFVGTNRKMSGIISNRYSLNILAGYNGSVDRLEVGGLVNIDRFYVHGVQFAGLANAVGREMKGVQAAGLFNTTLGPVKGVQIAGVNNLVLDSLKGVQVAGVVNITQGRTDGLQLAGVTNVALKNVDGVQLAGVLNVAVRDVNKTQVAGVINFGKDIPGGQFAGVMNTSYGRIGGIQLAGVLNSSRTVRTLQLAGVMNIAIDSVHGAQMAGVFNFTRKNHGFQLGLVNAGDSAAGLSVGLLNLYLRGYNKLELHTNETLPWSARVKLGANRKFYNIIGLGTQGFAQGELWGYTYGIGTAIPLGRKQRNMINIDLTATDLQEDDTWFEEWTVMGRLGVFYGQYLGKRFMVFGGPVFSNLFYDPDKAEEFPFILSIPPSNTLYHTRKWGLDMKGWIGFEFGLRLL